MSKLSALIVDPDGDSRNRARHALIEFGEFDVIEFSGALEDAQRKIAFGATYDVIFASQRFDSDTIVNFVRKSRATTCGRDATYVMILSTRDQTQAAIGLKYAVGVDSFLLEPYSSERILEIVELAFRVKSERAELRNRVALTLLVTDLVDQINLVAFLQSSGFDTTASMKKLSDLCRPLRELGEEAQSVYFDIISTLFPEASFPHHFQGSEQYRGLSDRVRKRMERKLVAELEGLKLVGYKPSQVESEMPMESEQKAVHVDGGRPVIIKKG